MPRDSGRVDSTICLDLVGSPDESDDSCRGLSRLHSNLFDIRKKEDGAGRRDYIADSRQSHRSRSDWSDCSDRRLKQAHTLSVKNRKGVGLKRGVTKLLLPADVIKRKI